MRTLIALLIAMHFSPVFADSSRCEEALIDAIKTEAEIASGEEWLFQASERAKLPQDYGWIKRVSERILQSEDRIGAEATFALYTALLAGLDPNVFKDPKFDKEILKPWAALRREARRLWTFTPPRYNTRLMYKLSMARLFNYLYS